MFLSFALTLLLLPAPGEKNSEIPRLHKIVDGFYRGGQPNEAGFDFLKKEGFKTIINLREENDEEAAVRTLGMNYVHIPLSVKIWSKVPEPAIQKYFEVLNNPANYPIFIHCRRGADRTGAMVGFYRIAAQGWDGKKAYKEARDTGMRWWFAGLKGQLNDFAKAAGSPLFKLGAALPVPPAP